MCYVRPDYFTQLLIFQKKNVNFTGSHNGCIICIQTLQTIFIKIIVIIVDLSSK